MRAALIPSDTGACCFYRVAWPGQAVLDAGWEVSLHLPDSVRLDVMPDGGVAIQGLHDLEDIDVIVLQRLASPKQVEFIRAVQSIGVAVVVDVDDALWRIHPENKSHERWNERVDGVRRFEHLDAACALADMVTVTTPLLAKRYGAHGRVRVLRNGLPNAAFAGNVAKTGFQDRIKIGWSGSLDSHPNDLQVMGDAVARIMAENDDVDLHIVGDAQPVADVLGIPFEMQASRRVSGTGWVPLDKYHEALRGIDVMLVPLADTAFNRAKSALKAQEAAAAGAVVVATGTPENVRLYGLGGYYGMMLSPSSSPNTWHGMIDSMLRHLRESTSGPDPERARFLEYSKRGDQWVEAWSAAVEHRRSEAQR